jgi:hypothetical protein
MNLSFEQSRNTIGAINTPSPTSPIAPSLPSSTNPIHRFSLLLLEPGEIYFEDFLVYYHELNCPFVSCNGNQTSTFNKPQKGNLKICSKSIIFDPLNLALPLIKFPYKMVEKIVRFDESNSSLEGQENTDYEDIYSSTSSTRKNSLSLSPEIVQLRSKCFAIGAKQHTLCKQNNKIGPYTLVKREQPNSLHYFQFIFTSPGDSLNLFEQLHRASTLDFEQEELMIQLIVKGRLGREVKFDMHQLDDMYKEQIQFESEVYKINPLVTNPGKILLTNMCLYYKPFNNLETEQQVLKIKLKYIKYVIKRRYHLKRVGCEVVFDKSIEAGAQDITNGSDSVSAANRRSLPYLYLTFEDEAKRDLFYTRLVVEQRDKLINLNEFTQENMLQKWRYGVISNFDYIMHLNNIADRSFNDLTQYPVFPWVLCDYTSSTLDLNEPKSFRDLSKPIGALNEERLQRFRQRCSEMQAATTTFSSSPSNAGQKKSQEKSKNNSDKQPIFLYGSHYSTPAFVLFYLVRQYPEWQLCLQNGRFDHPNRLFHSIADTWRNCLCIDSDVKELIPEFYDTSGYDDFRDDQALSQQSSAGGLYQQQLGQFLVNYQELDLGIRQDGVRVNHVILPPWANKSPSQFIRRMRDALESTCVSESLHKWIDLIFGYKQRGDEALKADNLFYYLCYEGAIDLDSITNYSEKKSLELQIQEFGQIPTQLFDVPHLQRVKADLVGDAKRLRSASQMSTGHLSGTSNEELLNRSISIESPSARQESDSKSKWDTSKQSKLKEIIPDLSELFEPYIINASNFKQLTVKLTVKFHKGQVNDCIFIEQPTINSSSLGSSSSNLDDSKLQLPLVCTVSNDNWLKIYSLEDRSIFRSHNVSNFSLSSVDCLQLLASSSLLIDQFDSQLKFTEDQQQQCEENRYRSRSGSGGPYRRTLLFLSCWDNCMHIYDMNYNRCIYTLNNAHDDALTRVRLLNYANDTLLKSSSSKRSRYKRAILLVTSSWDSTIKLWHSPLVLNQTSNSGNESSSASSYFSSSSPSSFSSSSAPASASLLHSDTIKVQLLGELSHESSVIDFELTKSYLASLCEDGNIYLWKSNKKHRPTDSNLVVIDSDGDEDEQASYEASNNGTGYNSDDKEDDSILSSLSDSSRCAESSSLYSFLYSIQCSADIGKINDCKIIETTEQNNRMSTLAICTSLGFIKIYNISTKKELFSLRLQSSSSSLATVKLNKLHYSNDFIVTIDSAGHIYFIDLKQQQTSASLTASSSYASLSSLSLKSDEANTSSSMLSNSISNTSSNSSFLSHTIKLTSCSLQSLCIYKDLIICVSDAEGNLYFLSLYDI